MPAATPVILAVVAELDHKYVYGMVPPVALAVAPPSEKPLQLTLLSTTLAADNAAGSVIVVDELSVQPFASVTVTLYVPATNPVAVAVVCPLFQLYVYGDVPPVCEAVACPSFNPLQLTLLSVVALDTKAAGSVIVVLELSVQPFASVTVTEYVPATNPVAVAVVCPLFQL